MLHQYGISALVSQRRHLAGKPVVALPLKCRLFSQAMKTYKHLIILKTLVKTDFQQAYKNMFS